MKNPKFIITAFVLTCSIFNLLLVGCFANSRTIDYGVQGISVNNASIKDDDGNLENFCVEVEINASLCHKQVELEDPNLQLNRIAYGLELPTSMAFLGYGDILVLERTNGTVQRIVNGNIQNEPLLDVPVNYAGDRGMLGIAVAKNEKLGSTNVFLYFTESLTGKDTYNITEDSSNRLYKYELIDNKLTNKKLLLNVSTSSPLGDGGHNGGKLRLGPDQNLYLIVGDLREHRTKAQNNQTGPTPDGTSVIYRITQDGKAVVPTVLGDEGPLDKFYAYGIRESFGLDFDPLTGKLWDTENGPNYGDEINLVERGFNSGWKRQQGFLINPYYPDAFVDIGEKDKAGVYSDPEFVWNQTVAPTALKFLNTDKLGKRYENDMLVGDGKFGNIYHFDLRDNRTKLALYTPLADKIAENVEELKKITFGSGFVIVSDVEVGPDGYPYVLSYRGDIWKIIPKVIPKTTLQ
jgi:glucose/arabinose dehydrogenase